MTRFAISIDIEASLEAVFDSLVDPKRIVEWMGQAARLKPEPGGPYELDINGVLIRGLILEIERPRRRVASWGQLGNTAMAPGPPE